MTPIRLMRSFATVGGWTMLSRVLGFARDILMARYLGAGAVSDAFFVAFSLPNMFRRLFAEGAFNAAFVPMFTKKLGSSHAEAQDFARDAYWLMASFLIGFSVLAMAAMPVLVWAMAAGFAGDGRFDLAVLIGGLAQRAMVWWAMQRAGFRLRPRWPQLTPELKRRLVIAAPAVLAGGVVQINLVVGRQVASFTENAISWLSYADRLYQLPLGVVGIAVGVVLLPELARRLREGDMEGGRDAFNRGAEFALALTIPAAVGLVVIALPIISVLFERGAFGPDDSANTALALAVYGLGLPAFVLHKVLQPLYFAREDTRSPFRYALVAMVVNAALAVGLMPVVGFIAAAIGTTVAGWVMVFQLWLGARPMGAAAQLDARMLDRLWRIALAAGVMGAVLWMGALALEPLLAGPMRALALAGLIVAGVATYFGFGGFIGAFRLSDLRAAMRRGR